MRQWATLMDGVDRLQLQEVSQPSLLGDNEVLVKIIRVSLNNRDVKRKILFCRLSVFLTDFYTSHRWRLQRSLRDALGPYCVRFRC